MSDDLTTLKVMGFLEKAYPYFFAKLNDEQARATIATYVEMLKDLDPVALQMAAVKHAAGSKFFPAISELRDAVGDMQERVLGLASAHEAWGEVSRAFNEIGYMRTPEFTNPLVMQAVQAVGGWKHLCHSENGMSDRAQFLKAYETLVQRAREDQRMLPQVKGYIDDLQAQRQLEVTSEIRKLTDRMRQ